MMRLIKCLPVISVSVLILLIISCEEDKNTNPQDQAPAIPPQSTMIIDFDEFPDTTGGGMEIPNLTKKNWGWAAYNVSVWNSVLTLTLAVPVAAFVEAFNHQPVKQADGSWLWQYSVVFNEALFTAKLFGKGVTEGVEWRMLLSLQGAYTDFEWFTGFSNLPATEGTWTLNKDPESPTTFLLIDWKRDTQQGTADVKYTKVNPIVPGNESYIHYGKTNEIPYNRFYQIYGAEENRLIDIKWNYEQYFGRVKDPIYFENENWNCWDEKLDDIPCPE